MAVVWNRPNSGGGGGNGVTYSAGYGITIENYEIRASPVDYELPLSTYEENGSKLISLLTSGDFTINDVQQLAINKDVFATLATEQTLTNKTLSAKLLDGVPFCFVETDAGGNLKADREIINSSIEEPSIQEVLRISGNWTNGTFIGNLGGTYAGQWFADGNYLYFFIADDTPIRLARV